MSRTNAGSASQSHFAVIPDVQIRRSTFDRSSTYKTTMDAGYLVPFFVDDVLPGDTFTYEGAIFGRLTTPIVPFMDNVYVDTHFFFVPNRLVWDNWEKFITGSNNGHGYPAVDTPSTGDYLVPLMNSGTNGFSVGGVADYMGIPTGVKGLEVDSMPFRAYRLIWNEWYRDENIYAPSALVTDDTYMSVDTLPGYDQLFRRGKRKDYFTSALPWPQKGPGVSLSLASTAPVIGNGVSLGLTNSLQQAGLTSYNGDLTALQSSYGKVIGSTLTSTSDPLGPLKAVGVSRDPSKSGLVADLTNATAITINSFRMAYQMQTLYELLARGGSRYTELIRVAFGVISPDARLQRPEYLGGSSAPLKLVQVAQTASTDTTTPQGNLAAYGVLTDMVPRWSKSFTEHGYVIGIMSIRADINYQQGIPRMFSRRTRWDYYWTALAHLGEQAILNKEIFAQGTTTSTSATIDNQAFGYQERYSEYRYGINKITGKLRSSDPQSLDYWHLAQDFETLPVLGPEFIQENPPFDRVLAVQDEPQFVIDVRNNLICSRPMPTYSVPGLISHL